MHLRPSSVPLEARQTAIPGAGGAVAAPHTSGRVGRSSATRFRSKTRTAQVNEALCKVPCHNLCSLIQSMYELGLQPKFWKEAA